MTNTFKLCYGEPIVVEVQRVQMLSVTGKPISLPVTVWFSYVVLPQGGKR